MYILFLLFLLANVSQGQYIRYGDKVKFYSFQQGYFNVDPDDKKIRTNETSSSIFEIRHPTNYKSKDILLGGQAVNLLYNNISCKITDKGYVIVSNKIEGNDQIRILDKHGRDKIELYDESYIKLRQPGNGIDCSLERNKALNCMVKRSWEYYGFIMMKV